MNNKLKFGSGNSKLAPNIFTFSLPAGYSCPGAKECLSRAVKQPEGNYKLIDGKQLSPSSFMWSESVRRTCLVVAPSGPTADAKAERQVNSGRRKRSVMQPFALRNHSTLA